MRTLARIVTGIIGLMLAATGVQWVFAPEIAASGLYLALPEDAMARSSLIGDFSAFFVTGSALCWLGALRQHAVWLHACALLLGTAALFRLNAFLFHDAGLPYEMVAVELVSTAFLLWAAPRVHLDKGHRHVATHSYGSEL